MEAPPLATSAQPCLAWLGSPACHPPSPRLISCRPKPSLQGLLEPPGTLAAADVPGLQLALGCATSVYLQRQARRTSLPKVSMVARCRGAVSKALTKGTACCRPQREPSPPPDGDRRDPSAALLAATLQALGLTLAGLVAGAGAGSGAAAGSRGRMLARGGACSSAGSVSPSGGPLIPPQSPLDSARCAALRQAACKPSRAPHNPVDAARLLPRCASGRSASDDQQRFLYNPSLYPPRPPAGTLIGGGLESWLRVDLTPLGGLSSPGTVVGLCGLSGLAAAALLLA